MSELVTNLPFHIERAIEDTVAEFADSKKISWQPRGVPMWFIFRDLKVSKYKMVRQRLQVAVFREVYPRNLPALSIVPDVAGVRVDGDGSHVGAWEDVFGDESRRSLIRNIDIYNPCGYPLEYAEVSANLKTDLGELWGIVSKIKNRRSARALCDSLRLREG